MSGRLRVLLLCDRLDVAGGVERFVCTLANHLAAQGHGVAVGTVATSPQAIAYPLALTVSVLHGDTPLPAGDGPRAMLERQRLIGRTLSRLMREHDPDVVLLNGLTTACSVLLVDRSLASRTICCDHNHFSARSWPWRLLRRWLYPQVATVVSLTRADQARFTDINPRTEVIYNASALPRPYGRSRTGSIDDRPRVIAVGRHVRQKGLDLLLRAWVPVAAALPQARLRIVGDGPLRDALREQARQAGISRSVEWFERIDDMLPQYRGADVFVLPSRYEGMPLALLEAQAVGLPSVAFDCPTGPAEIIDVDSGVLVPAGDVAALSRALIALLQDPAGRHRMGRAARRRSRQLFSRGSHLQHWQDLIERVGSARHRASGPA
jgi:glycosyltransferase involved in cell wall biosynthesis